MFRKGDYKPRSLTEPGALEYLGKVLSCTRRTSAIRVFAY